MTGYILYVLRIIQMNNSNRVYIRDRLQNIANAIDHCRVNPSAPVSRFRAKRAPTGSLGRGVLCAAFRINWSRKRRCTDEPMKRQNKRSFGVINWNTCSISYLHWFGILFWIHQVTFWMNSKNKKVSSLLLPIPLPHKYFTTITHIIWEKVGRI